jgi:uncharacterized tellurite resistance protein B-like protein
MFKNVKDFFSGSTSLEFDRFGRPTSKDLKVATLVLLELMAVQDENISLEEYRSIFELMNEAFGASVENVGDFLEIADAIPQNTPKLDQFVGVINQYFDTNQRQKLFSMVWRIAAADQYIHKFEESLGAELGSKLSLSKSQIEEAKAMTS